jgi:amidohydrolase
VDAVFDEMVRLRRHLHMYPEPSGEELDTSQEIYSRFLNRGLEVRQGPNGCGVLVDVLPSPDPTARMIALRADIDGLRIQDEKEVPYRSRKPALMHACGHDAHTATVFGSRARFK